MSSILKAVRHAPAILLAGVMLFTITSLVNSAESSSRDDLRIEEVSFSISGTSNVRDWEIKSESMTGTIRTGPAFFSEAENADGDLAEHYKQWFDEVSLVIANHTLDSGISAMNQAMHQYLKTEEHPQIRYKLDSIENIWTEPENSGWVVKARATTHAAGVDHQITHDVLIDRISSTSFAVSGEIPLTFTDFKIDPPTFMRGALRTGNEMGISFRVVLSSSR